MPPQLPQEVRYDDIDDVEEYEIFSPVRFVMLTPVEPQPLPQLRHVTQRLQNRTYDVSPQARETEHQSFQRWHAKATRPYDPSLPSGTELLNQWRSKLDECEENLIKPLAEAQWDIGYTRSAQKLDQQKYTVKKQVIEPSVVQGEPSLPLSTNGPEPRGAEGSADMSARIGNNITASIQDEAEDPFYAPIDFSVIQDPFPEFKLDNVQTPVDKPASDAGPVNVSGTAQYAFVLTPRVDEPIIYRTTRPRAKSAPSSARSIYNMHSSKKASAKRAIAYRPREDSILAGPAS